MALGQRFRWEQRRSQMTHRCGAVSFLQFFSQKKKPIRKQVKAEIREKRKKPFPQAVVGGLESSLLGDAVDVQCLRGNSASSWTRNPSGSAVNCTERRLGVH